MASKTIRDAEPNQNANLQENIKGYLECKETSKGSEFKTAAEERLCLSTLHLSDGSHTGNGLSSNKMGKDISDFDVQASADGDNMGTSNEAPQCDNVSFRDGDPNQIANLQENTETMSSEMNQNSENISTAKKMKLTKISICIDSRCASFETSDGQKYSIGPLCEYLSMLRQSKALKSCETHITFDPSRIKWSDPETAIAVQEKFEKFSQEIHSIVHLWAKGRVMAELHNYPAENELDSILSNVCEELFGQGRSILACDRLKISLTDDWPFSVTPSKRLILKEMHQYHLTKDQQLRYKFLDAVYKKKMPQNIAIIFEFCHNKYATEFCDKLKKRFQLSTGGIYDVVEQFQLSTRQDFQFMLRSPGKIPETLLHNTYGKLEIKSSALHEAGQAQYSARVEQHSSSCAPKQQPA